MNMRIYIPVLLLSLLVASCCKRKQYCKSGTLKVAFVGFQYSEIRSFVLRRYAADDTAKIKAIDSSQLVYAASSQTAPGVKDTVWLSDYKSNGVLHDIYYGNSWTLTAPISGMYYAITSIYDEEHRSDIVKCNDKETDCVNNIRTFAINDFWQNGDLLYIVK